MLVGHDTTIEGSFFRNSPVEQQKETFVGEVQTGVAVQFLKYFELSYSVTYRSEEFEGQNGWDSFAALSLSMVYAW
jgi:hypothetical protein